MKNHRIRHLVGDSNGHRGFYFNNCGLFVFQQPIQIDLDTSRYSDTPDFLPIHLSTNRWEGFNIITVSVFSIKSLFFYNYCVNNKILKYEWFLSALIFWLNTTHAKNSACSLAQNTSINHKQCTKLKLRAKSWNSNLLTGWVNFYCFPCSTNEEDSNTLADNYRFLNISIKSQADLEING